MEHMNLTSTNPFTPADLPCPVKLSSYGDALSAIQYFVGKYAERINKIACLQGHESRQRLLFAIVRLIFFWKEKNLPVAALKNEVPGLLEWAETNSLSSAALIS